MNWNTHSPPPVARVNIVGANADEHTLISEEFA